jgi:hypothetical protein
LQSSGQACIFCTSSPNGQIICLASYVFWGNSFGLGTNFCIRDKTSLNLVSNIPFLDFISRSKILASNFVTVEPLYSGVCACFLIPSNFFWFFHQGNLAPPTSIICYRACTTSLYSFPGTATVSSTPSITVSRTVSFSFTCPVSLHLYLYCHFVYPLKLVPQVGSHLLPHVSSKQNSLAWNHPKQMIPDILHSLPLLKIFAIPAWAIYETKSLNIMLHVSTHGTDKQVKTLHECKWTTICIHPSMIHLRTTMADLIATRNKKMNTEVMLSKDINNTVISEIS